jgi:hypothetical protein
MMIVIVWQYTFMKTEKEHETESHVFKIFIWIIIWNSFVSYMTNYNYVKWCSFIMRYLNNLILKGGIKRVSLLLAISIDYDHMVFFFFFFMYADALAELVLKRVEDIVRMSFSLQYVICIFYIRSIFAWLSYSPLFFCNKKCFIYLFLQFLILFNCI